MCDFANGPRCHNRHGPFSAPCLSRRAFELLQAPLLNRADSSPIGRRRPHRRDRPLPEFGPFCSCPCRVKFREIPIRRGRPDPRGKGGCMPLVENAAGRLWIDVEDSSEVGAIRSRLRELLLRVTIRVPDLACGVSVQEANWVDSYLRIVPRNGPQARHHCRSGRNSGRTDAADNAAHDAGRPGPSECCDGLQPDRRAATVVRGQHPRARRHRPQQPAAQPAKPPPRRT
jgi:hypothetical protein